MSREIVAQKQDTKETRMEYIKSRWLSNNTPDEVAQPTEKAQTTQPIETSYNSVTFTNSNSSSQNNPIIISTTQHPSQISIIHEVRNQSLKVPDMTSPTDSFHSVVSTFHNEKCDGKVNMGYTGSSADMNNQQQQRHQQSNQSPTYPPNQWVFFHTFYRSRFLDARHITHVDLNPLENSSNWCRFGARA